MIDLEQIKDEVMLLVFDATHHHVQAQEIEQILADKLGVPSSTIREAVQSLVDDGELTFGHQDAFDYLQIASAGEHHAARPLEVVFDEQGIAWICDKGVDRSRDLVSQGCWACGDLAFTASD